MGTFRIPRRGFSTSLRAAVLRRDQMGAAHREGCGWDIRAIGLKLTVIPGRALREQCEGKGTQAFRHQSDLCCLGRSYAVAMNSLASRCRARLAGNDTSLACHFT